MRASTKSCRSSAPPAATWTSPSSAAANWIPVITRPSGADAGGDTVNYSHRYFAEGKLTTIYGGEECLLTPTPIDSLGHAYAAATAALGFTPLRHEGKITGLAASGEPVVGREIAAHFCVD